MLLSLRSPMLVRLVLLGLFIHASALAQEPAAGVAPNIRPLAPGVLTVIPTAREATETFAGPRAIVEITVGIPGLEWTPNYEPKSATLIERAKNVTFRRRVWNLE